MRYKKKPGQKLWKMAQQYIQDPDCDPDILNIIIRTLKRLGYPELKYETKAMETEQLELFN